MLGAVLLVTVALFETDMRINGWQDRAVASRFWTTAGLNWIDVALSIHLCFAVTTALAWIAVIGRALANFPSPPQPGPHSAWHRRWAKLAAIDMLLTALTGWLFYCLAFVASHAHCQLDVQRVRRASSAITARCSGPIMGPMRQERHHQPEPARM